MKILFLREKDRLDLKIAILSELCYLKMTNNMDTGRIRIIKKLLKKI